MQAVEDEDGLILKVRVLRCWKAARACRSDLACLDTDMQAVAGLQKLNETHAERRLSFCRIGSSRGIMLVVRW